MGTHAANAEAHFICMRCCMALCCTLAQDSQGAIQLDLSQSSVHLQSGFAEVGGMQILTELYAEYPFSGHGQAMHPQLHHTAGADPGSYEAIKAALLDCIWTAGLSHGQTDVNAMYFAQHGLSAAAGSVTALAATAWSGFAQEKHRADMRHFIWSKPCLEPAKRAELEKVVRVVCKCVSAVVRLSEHRMQACTVSIHKLFHLM